MVIKKKLKIDCEITSDSCETIKENLKIFQKLIVLNIESILSRVNK